VKNDVIVGGCVTVLPNVTINENSVIAAGSVVTKDIPAATVVKGVPAETMMTRKEYESKRKRFIAARKH
jgi:acetyltransferase-like isoleucine patch superfamily enzyme